ncbi:MAG TPA: 16S rRNA (cytosine(1402)-N(4))-methyltransferase, partial [Acidimicrobiales bacterium]
TGRTALERVNEADAGELAALFMANGEGRLAGRIARAIVAARPLTSTAELADVVSRAVPAAARRRGHPARRVFQAVRIAVNEELDELAAVLPAALDRLAVGGRLVVIAYHSGEDRLVKSVLATAVTGGCTCPPGLPCVCGARPEHRLVFRGSRKASAAELAANHRAESARLRAVERIEERDSR